MREVTVTQFASARADGACTIDVREPDEYLAGHVPGARLIPLGQLTDRVDDLRCRGPVYVVCASGNRSLTAARILADAGIEALSVRGGTTAWTQAGLPVVRGAVADVA